MMACYLTIDAKSMTPRGEPRTDATAQRVQDSFKFRNLYDPTDFSLEKMFAIIEPTVQSMNSNLAEKKKS